MYIREDSSRCICKMTYFLLCWLQRSTCITYHTYRSKSLAHFSLDVCTVYIYFLLRVFSVCVFITKRKCHEIYILYATILAVERQDSTWRLTGAAFGQYVEYLALEVLPVFFKIIACQKLVFYCYFYDTLWYT